MTAEDEEVRWWPPVVVGLLIVVLLEVGWRLAIPHWMGLWEVVASSWGAVVAAVVGGAAVGAGRSLGAALRYGAGAAVLRGVGVSGIALLWPTASGEAGWRAFGELMLALASVAGMPVGLVLVAVGWRVRRG